MTNLIRIGAMLGAILVASSAQAAVSNRAECYDVVIAHCNTTNHAQSCAMCGRLRVGKSFVDLMHCRWSELPCVRPLDAALDDGRWP